MTRENRLGGHRRAGESVQALLGTILEDIVKAAAMPEHDWQALSQFPLPPLAIPVSVGREYRVTQAGVDAAHQLTDQVWKKREDYRQTIEREAFDRLSFSAIGQAIRATHPRLLKEAGDADGSVEHDSTFYQELAAEFEKILGRLAEEIRIDVDRHIPCTLFHEDQLVPAFSVGPIEFLPRADWIEHFVGDRETRTLVDEVEQGQTTRDEVRQRILRPDSGPAIRDALTVIDFLRGFSWVGTIRAVGHEARQSHRKMSTIVGLAIDTVGLLFHRDDALRFTKAGRAHLFGEHRLATTVDGGRFIRGSSVNMPGLGSAPGALAAKMQEEHEFLNAAGTILNAYLESRQKTGAPHLVEAWVNVLHWIGEARRDESDFMAVMKYGCAVDMLSGAGGDSRAITEFAEAALTPREAGESHDSALTVAEAVKMVYVEGRSKLAHGETAGLLEDFSEPRKVGDFLLANLSYVVTPVLAEIIADEDSRVLGVSKQHACRYLKERMQRKQ